MLPNLSFSFFWCGAVTLEKDELDCPKNHEDVTLNMNFLESSRNSGNLWRMDTVYIHLLIYHK